VRSLAGKVKFIYIDPPYNTRTDANTFAYNNNFNHSSWLTFMRNRLEVAKELLTEDGMIFIDIDHYELFYLGVLADEIFGFENRLGVLAVVHNLKVDDITSSSRLPTKTRLCMPKMPKTLVIKDLVF
jgi:adenine-specific DNA-methyltransferase